MTCELVGFKFGYFKNGFLKSQEDIHTCPVEEIDTGKSNTTTTSSTTTSTVSTAAHSTTMTTTTASTTTSSPSTNTSDPVDCSSANATSDDPLKSLYCNLTAPPPSTKGFSPPPSFNVSVVSSIVMNATAGARLGNLSYLQVYEVSVILDKVSKKQGVVGNMTSRVSPVCSK